MPAKVSMKRLAERVRTLRGWRRRGAALAAGAASVFAMPPCFAWPVLWITLPVLVWLIDGVSWHGEPSVPPGATPALSDRSDLDRARPHSGLRRWYDHPPIAAAEI